MSLVPLAGCSEPERQNGTAGAGGSGGTGGGQIDNGCQPQPYTCTDGTIDEHAPCCAQIVPEQEDACTGIESLENPRECTRTGSPIGYGLTLLEVVGSCHTGYNLDAYDGMCCLNGDLAPYEGIYGVDNALTGLGPVLESMGSNLGHVNQTLSDALCGLTNECSQETAALEVRFEIDANFEERCANVKIIGGASSSDVILHLSDLVVGSGACTNGAGGAGGNGGVDGTACTTDADCDGAADCEGTVACASGTLGTIPVSIARHAGALDNVVVRMSVSELGFSHGLLGATLDEATAVALVEGGQGDVDIAAVVGRAFEISGDLIQGTHASCDALSAAFVVAGVAAAMEAKGSLRLPRGASFR